MMFSISVTLHDIVHTDKSLTLVFEYLERDLKQYMDDCGAILAMNNVKLFLYQVSLSNILLYKIKCKRYFASIPDQWLLSWFACYNRYRHHHHLYFHYRCYEDWPTATLGGSSTEISSHRIFSSMRRENLRSVIAINERLLVFKVENLVQCLIFSGQWGRKSNQNWCLCRIRSWYKKLRLIQSTAAIKGY